MRLGSALHPDDRSIRDPRASHRGRTRERLSRTLAALPLLYPSDATWHTIDDWTARAGKRGERFSLGDLLVGALAADHQALVWSLDDDFKRLASLGLVRL